MDLDLALESSRGRKGRTREGEMGPEEMAQQ